MKPTAKTIISVAEILTPIIGSRDVVQRLRDKITKATTGVVVLDFSKVEFISRSAAHELIEMKENLINKLLKKKEIIFDNLNSEVSEMLRVVAANRVAPKKEFQPPKFEKQSLANLLKQEFI